MNNRRAYVLIASCALSAGASAQSVAFKATSTVFLPIGAENVELGFQTNRPANLPATTRELGLASECGATPDPRLRERSLLSSALSTISRAGVRLILERIERKVQAELERYSAVYRAETEGLFYRYADANGRPLLRYNCLRIARLTSEAPDAAAQMDLLLRIRLSPQGDALLLTPLRLHISQAAGATADGSLNVSVNLAGHAVWRDGTIGRSEQIFDQIVFDARVALDASGISTRYFDTDEVAPVLLPIMPISTSTKLDEPYGYARLTATVAETGIPSTSLEAAVDLLARRNDAVTAALLRALESRLLAMATD